MNAYLYIKNQVVIKNGNSEMELTIDIKAWAGNGVNNLHTKI